MSTTLATFNDLPFAGFKIEAKPTGSHMWGLWFGDIILADAMNKDEATYFAAIHNLRVDADRQTDREQQRSKTKMRKTSLSTAALAAAVFMGNGQNPGIKTALPTWKLHPPETSYVFISPTRGNFVSRQSQSQRQKRKARRQRWAAGDRTAFKA